MNILEEWNEEVFFSNYWGIKPCVIKSFITSDQIKNFDIGELSSLAMEDDIVSRIINYKCEEPEKIKLFHGPFTEDYLTNLPIEEPWSLLVQDVDKKSDSFKFILDKFKQIPAPFFDDVMVSIGNLGSGTGPHLDWYNVFILQTNGKKQWSVEKSKRTYKDHDQSLIENADLKVLKSLIESFVLELLPGECLYIPPGHGHHGVSSANLSMSFSIGFQGPRLITLIETYLSECLGHIHEDQRVNYSPQSQSKLNLSEWPNEIELKILNGMEELLKKAKERDY